MKSVVAVIIPVYNRLRITQKGLGYIQAAVRYYEALSNKSFAIKVIIVDDGSTDGTTQWIQANHPQFTVLAGDGNLWWTGAVNKGIQHSLDTYHNLYGVILQNDDVMLEETWLAELLAAVTSHPHSLMGCATAVQEEKDVILYGGRQLNPWFAKEKKTNYKAPRNRFIKGYVTPSFDLYGRGLFIPASVFKTVGLFNAKGFKHRGDMDVPLRAKKAGFQLLVSYDAIVYELPQMTFSLDVKRKITFKEAYKLLTDFRSSNNFGFIYRYSKAATNNPFQFAVFFFSSLFYHLRGISRRLVRHYASV